MLDRIRSNGVVGAGGAGFPTYKKLEAAADTVIVNAAECEPLLHKDKEILRHHLDAVLDGLLQVVRKAGAGRAIVAIKEKYQELIAEISRRGAVDGIELFPLGDYYPAGDEFITVYETTGRVIPPGGLPLDVGCLVVNVETLLNVALDRPVTHKFLTVGGDVPQPVTVRVPIGAAYGDVLRTVGVDTDAVGHVLIGGVMMGQIMRSLEEPVTRTTGALLCFPKGHSLPRRYLTESRERDLIGKSACDQCSFCTELCPRYLLGHPIEPHMAMRGLQFNMVGDALVLGSQFCSGCNLCSLYACPEDLFPKDACLDNKHMMRAKSLEHPDLGRTDVRPHSMQEYRHIPVASLIKKLGLSGFRNVGELTEFSWQLEEVRIPLQQHAGLPAVPVVAVGQRVRESEEIGAAPNGLGVPVHASIDGIVTSVGDDVVIRRNR